MISADFDSPVSPKAGPREPSRVLGRGLARWSPGGPAGGRGAWAHIANVTLQMERGPVGNSVIVTERQRTSRLALGPHQSTCHGLQTIPPC